MFHFFLIDILNWLAERHYIVNCSAENAIIVHWSNFTETSLAQTGTIYHWTSQLHINVNQLQIL